MRGRGVRQMKEENERNRRKRSPRAVILSESGFDIFSCVAGVRLDVFTGMSCLEFPCFHVKKKRLTRQRRTVVDTAEQSFDHKDLRRIGYHLYTD